MRILLIGDVLNGHSGSPKVLLNVARSFKMQGHEVKLVFFGESDDSDNIKPRFQDFDYIIWKSRLLSRMESPLSVYISKSHSDFKKDDVGGVLLQFFIWYKIRRMKFKPDIILYLNLWSSFSAMISPINKNNVVLLHEAPIFEEFNPLIRKILRLYAKVLMKKLTTLSITESIMKSTNSFYKVDTGKISIIHFEDFPSKGKEDFVLLDTRWTYERDPFFAIELSKKMRHYPIVMHGFFPNKSLENEVKKTITQLKLDIRVLSGLSDIDLSNLYDSAKVVVRWHANHEEGPSITVLDAISHNCIPVIDEKLTSAVDVKHNISPDLIVNKSPDEFARVILRVFEDKVFYLDVFEKLREFKKRNTWLTFTDELILNLGDFHD